MKNKRVIILLIVLAFVLGFVCAVAYATLERLFPLASPISLPSIDDISSVRYGTQNEFVHTLEPEEYGELLQILSAAQPTREISVNDQPYVRPYYTISIQTPQREYRYYLYLDDGQAYIEDPYVGIYRTDPKWIDYIAH